MRAASHPRPVNLAFTVLELLVSSAILSIVVAILLSVLTTSMTTWRTTQGKIEVDNEGRAGTLLLMQDIDNMMLPSSPELWPEVSTNSDGVNLRFLTLKPLDYQGSDGNLQENIGDVCYVEYTLTPTGALMRGFHPSKWTYENALLLGSLPPPGSAAPQILSTNILTDMKNAVRGSKLYSEAGQTGFVILATNNPGYPNEIMPAVAPLSRSNPPVGLEINFAATDWSSAQNTQLLENPSYRLRNSGYFSVRFDFPKTH